MKAHPVTDCYPMMTPDEMNHLVVDIRQHGLRQPIVVKDGVLLDGRNRLRACREAGVEPRFAEYDGDDVVQYILSTNNRRNLTQSQRAMVAAAIANIQRGQVGRSRDRQTGKSAALVTQAEAAKAMGVSERSVRAARRVQNADPRLAAHVASGKVTVSAAEQQLKHQPTETPTPGGPTDGGPRVPRDATWEADRALEILRDIAPDAPKLPLAFNMVMHFCTKNAPKGADRYVRLQDSCVRRLSNLSARIVTLLEDENALVASRDKIVKGARAIREIVGECFSEVH